MSTHTTRRSTLAATAATAVLALLAGCSASSGTPAGSSGTTVYQVGIAQLVSHPSLDAIREGVKAGFADAGLVEGTNVVFDEQNPQGDQAALTSIAANFKSSKKDLVVAITTPVGVAMAQAITDKPVIFTGVTDPVTAKLVDSFESPGGNLSGVSDYPPMAEMLQLVLDVKPGTKTIGMVSTSSEINAQVQVQLAQAAAAPLGLTIKVATITNSSEVQQAAASLAGVDAFFVSNDNTVVSAIEAVIQVAEQQGVPVVASDPDSVARGAVAAYAINQYQMGYQAGQMAAKVLTQGLDPATIPVVNMADVPGAMELTLNPSAAARQGVTLSDSLLARATTTV